MKLESGSVVWVALGSRLPPGHEQEGERPALVVGVPARAGRPRFPLLWVVPVTSYQGQPWADGSPRLYPCLPAGAGNLSRPSLALLDQLQALDVRRVLRFLGRLGPAEYAPVRSGLACILD